MTHQQQLVDVCCVSPARRQSRKRSRCSTSLLLFAAAATTLLHPVGAFVVGTKRPAISSTALEGGRSAVSEIVKPLTPMSANNKKRRDEAVKAMKRTKVETALDGVDAQMLELLSEHFLYPDKRPPQTNTKVASKPRGRPDFVPGAMKFETMLRFQEQQGVMGMARDLDPYVGDTRSKDPWTDEKIGIMPASNRKPTKVKGSSAAVAEDALPEAPSRTKRRKPVVKNLPQRKDASEEAPAPMQQSNGRTKANNLELQKYYRTELLSADEEYALGMKVQLMVKCEQVHEGLAAELMRLPTIEEWAAACGYVQQHQL